MCESALPPHLDEAHEREAAFPDDDQYSAYGFVGQLFRRFKKWSRAARAFGPRDVHWYHRWREMPITVFVLSTGYLRWELEYPTMVAPFSQWGSTTTGKDHKAFFWQKLESAHLSRIQYWTRAHVALHWPLCITWNIYWRKKDVPEYPSKRTGLTLREHFTGYIGFPFNSDRYYTGPTFSIGARFK